MRVFGFYILSPRELDYYRRVVSVHSAETCRSLATPRGIECEGELAPGMRRAVSEIDLWIKELRD